MKTVSRCHDERVAPTSACKVGGFLEDGKNRGPEERRSALRPTPSPSRKLGSDLSQWIPACTGMTLVLLAAFCFAPAPSFGQVTTGIPPFSSFSGGSFDMVNNANLNIHFAIPIVNKAGRGLPFDYALSFDSSLWSPLSYFGQSAWTPAQFWGWEQLDRRTQATSRIRT